MIRFATINIEGTRHLERVEAFLREQQPQVVCLQEVFEETLPALTAAMGGEAFFAPMAYVKPGTEAPGQHSGRWGVAVISTYRVSEIWELTYKSESTELPLLIPGNTPNAVNRVLLVTDFHYKDSLIRLATTHFTWTPNGKTTQEQQSDFAMLEKFLAQYAPDILCGDFNAARDLNPIFEHLAFLMKDNLPRAITTTIDRTLHKAGDLQLVVDGIFTSEKIRAFDVETHLGVSDHCALTATMNTVSLLPKPTPVL